MNTNFHALDCDGTDCAHPSHAILDDGQDEYVSRCPACGDPIDYCQGHGGIGDPTGARILAQHDDGDHADCAPSGCDEALAALQARAADGLCHCYACEARTAAAAGPFPYVNPTGSPTTINAAPDDRYNDAALYSHAVQGGWHYRKALVGRAAGVPGIPLDNATVARAVGIERARRVERDTANR